MLPISITLSEHLKEKPQDESKLGFGRIFTDHMFIMNYEDKSRATADVLSGSTDTTDWSIEESVSIISQEIHPPKATASEYDIFGEQNKAVTFYANIKEWEMFESNCDDAGVYSSSMLVYLIEQFNRDVALKRLESAVAQDKAEQINQLFKKK